MRVLVAPDKFGGTLTAEQASRAIVTGWRRVRPADRTDEAPMADGGDGTLDALLAALGGQRRRARVTGPLGDPVDADYGLIDAPEGPTAVIEMARASGLRLVDEGRRDPLRATTRGTGELILEACRSGAGRVLVCVGGSATTDGGAGLAQAVGIGLLTAEGSPIGPGGRGLLELARIDVGGLAPAVRAASVSVATDVDNPLIGPAGAAAAYGPQKGAGPDAVVLLDRALAHLAAIVHRDLGIDVRDVPGAGAAGGLGGGLVAFLGARLRPGVEVVMDALGLRERIAASDLAITGEGRLDAASLRGKVVSGLLAAARVAGVPLVVLCGSAEIHPEGARVLSLVERFGEARPLERARESLESLAEGLAAEAELVVGAG